jgi:hypothetical protein
MKKTLLFFSSIITLSAFSQSAAFNSSVATMCGCPGELWDFTTAYKPSTSFSTIDHTKRLMHTGFGFNVPATSTITGVKVEFDYTSNAATGTLRDSNVAILLAGSPNGQDKSGETPFYGTSGHKTLGGLGDVWLMGLTPSHINDPGFGFNIRFYSSVMGTVFNLETGVTMTVYYMTAAGINESQSSSQGLKIFHSDRTMTIENTTDEKADLEMFDLTGKSVLKNSFEGNKTSIDTGSLSEGVYIYKVKTSTRSKIARIVLE